MARLFVEKMTLEGSEKPEGRRAGTEHEPGQDMMLYVLFSFSPPLSDEPYKHAGSKVIDDCRCSRMQLNYFKGRKLLRCGDERNTRD